MAGEWLLVKKTLLFESFKEIFAHRFAILLGVSDVGEDLGKGLYVVNSHELLVFFEGFFLGIEIIYFCWGVCLEMFLVHDTAQW